MDNLRFSKEKRVGIIKLNRPESLNALDKAMTDEMTVLLNDLKNSDVKILIITGNDKIFCAGADINEAHASLGSATTSYEFSKRYQRLFGLIEEFPIPVIAAISGYALGGGCELALACDLRIASATAKFGVPEINIGAFPAGGGTQKLPRLIGGTMAKEILMTGRSIGAEEALRLGLVNKVYPVCDYLEEAKKLAEELTTKPMLALAAVKTLVNKGIGMDINPALEFEARTFSAMSTSHDFSEGTKAFLEKRAPKFEDR